MAEHPLREAVSQLRPILSVGRSASGYLALFDEFIREFELGLALHCVCDYLLEDDAGAADRQIVDRVSALHQVMCLDDDCVFRLREKMGCPPVADQR